MLTGKQGQGKKKSSRGDTSRMHPYMAAAIMRGIDRDNWQSSKIVRVGDTVTVETFFKQI